MSRASYSLSVAFWVDVVLRALIASFVFSSLTFEQMHEWPAGVGFGAIVAFSSFSVFSASAFGTSKRLSPINAMRLSGAMFLFFAAMMLARPDKAVFVIAYAFLGLTATSGSVLLWWSHGQDTQQQTVLYRHSIMNALANVPLAIVATLMHTRIRQAELILSIMALLVGVIIVVWLQQMFYARCCKVPVPVSLNTDAAAYNTDVLVYDDEKHCYGPTANSLADKPPTTTTSAVGANELTLSEIREMGQFTIEDTDSVGEAASTASTQQPEAVKQAIITEHVVAAYQTPDRFMQARLDLWMGPWTAITHFTVEALLFYNVAGWSDIGAPWFVTAVAIGAYSTVIVICLSSCLRARTAGEDHHFFTPYLAWYKLAVAVLVLSTILHAVLEMSPWALQYAPHVVLSLFYMPPLSLATSLPLFRTYALCQKQKFSFYALLPRWFMAVALGRAIAYMFQFASLYFHTQLLAMMVLCVLNMLMYIVVRRDEIGAALD